MPSSSSSYIDEALASSLDDFVARHPYLFLYGLVALESSITDDRVEEEEAAGELYADQGGETKIVSAHGRTQRAAQVLLASPVQKRTSTFPQMITIGRTANNDIVLDDPSVSRFHAYFRVAADEATLAEPLQLCDADSGNGTFVNGDRVARNPPTEVATSDVIRIGNIELTLLRAEQVWHRVQRRK